jgi:hypothetical protein
MLAAIWLRSAWQFDGALIQVVHRKNPPSKVDEWTMESNYLRKFVCLQSWAGIVCRLYGGSSIYPMPLVSPSMIVVGHVSLINLYVGVAGPSDAVHQIRLLSY